MVSENSVLKDASGSSGWVNCKSNYECHIADDGIVTLRFGSSGSYFYSIYEDFDGASVTCDATNFGNPSGQYGDDNTCQYTTAQVFDVPDSNAFEGRIDGGTTFTLEDDGDYWVRYVMGPDYGGQKMYIIGGNAQDIECSPENFGIVWLSPNSNPPGYCQVGSLFEQADGDPKLCASVDGNACDIDTKRAVLFRYTFPATDGDIYDYSTTSVGHIESQSIPCTRESFSPKYSSVEKNTSCTYQHMTPASMETEGVWIKEVSCIGESCPISHAMEVGTTRTEEWSSGQEWGADVSASIESDFKIFGSGVSVSTGVASSYAQSASFTEAVQKTEMETYTATCDYHNVYQTRSLWRFSTQTRTSCFQDGSCVGTTLTADYACIGDEPDNYKGPFCVPGYCDLDKDPFCQVCTYDE